MNAVEQSHSNFSEMDSKTPTETRTNLETRIIIIYNNMYKAL